MFLEALNINDKMVINTKYNIAIPKRIQTVAKQKKKKKNQKGSLPQKESSTKKPPITYGGILKRLN